MSNGSHLPNGHPVAASLSDDSHRPTPGPSFSSQGERILELVHSSGFKLGAYSDFTLTTPERLYRLHRLLLSASPRLRPLLDGHPDATTGSRQVQIPLDQAGMTEEGFAICLGHLYSNTSASFLAMDPGATQTEDSARLFSAVLSGAVWLGGMDDLVQVALQKCLESVCSSTVLGWIHLLSVPSQPPPFGETYHAQLLARVKDQLVLHIPTSSGAFANLPNAQGQVELEELYEFLPWNWLKETIEHPVFPASERQRFSFAKSILQRRKSSPEVRASGQEETVVLAFGGGGFNVCLTRKGRRGKALFKIND